MTTPRSTAEGLARHAVGWLYSATYLPMMMVVCALVTGKARQWVAPAMVRTWGRTMMRIGGVGLVVDPKAEKLLSDRKARVLLFNHSSSLDTLVGAAVLPPGGVLVLKREFIWLPFMGIAAWFMGSVFIDRANSERARASLAKTARRIRDNQLQPLIAPEGTRVKTPEMGRFKLGAFYMARDAGIPVQPVVLHKCQDIWPHTALAPGHGTVVVTTLEEVAVDTADNEGLRAIASEVRERYIAELARVDQQ